MAAEKPNRAPLFRTESKAKIGKDQSWPIGAESLSAVLFDVPQREFIRLEFAEADRFSLQKDRPPLIFEAEYYFRGPTIFSPKGSLSPTWRIIVRAVPRQWKYSVKGLMLECGLPQVVKPWLIKNSGPLKREGNAGLRLWYNPFEAYLIHRSFGHIGPTLVA